MDKKDRLIAKLKDQQRACAKHDDDTFVDNHHEANEILQHNTRIEKLIDTLKDYFLYCSEYEFEYNIEDRNNKRSYSLQYLNNCITTHKRYLEQNLTSDCCNLFYNLIDKLQSRFHIAQRRGSQVSICQACDELALKYQELDKEVDKLYEKLKTEIRKENIMNQETYIPHEDEPKIDYSKFDVRKTLILSTGHLPAAVAKLLDSQKDEVKRGVNDLSSFHGYTDFGYKFYTPEPNEKFDYFGSDVENILVFAKQELGCDYVEFDADGKVYEEFKQFNW